MIFILICSLEYKLQYIYMYFGMITLKNVQTSYMNNKQQNMTMKQLIIFTS